MKLEAISPLCNTEFFKGVAGRKDILDSNGPWLFLVLGVILAENDEFVAAYNYFEHALTKHVVFGDFLADIFQTLAIERSCL